MRSPDREAMPTPPHSSRGGQTPPATVGAGPPAIVGAGPPARPRSALAQLHFALGLGRAAHNGFDWPSARVYYARGVRLMLKRFIIGFVLGVGGMYWYIHHAEETFAGANQWMQRSASAYRDDKIHQAADEATGKARP
jgi:hypothetical protein